MTQEPRSKALDEFIETTAEQIIVTLAPGAPTGDPKLSVIQLLESFLDNALLQIERERKQEIINTGELEEERGL